MKAFRSGMAAISLFCLVSAVPLWAQAGPRVPRNPLAMLERALANAGANPLTSDQQQQLQTMITTFRNGHQKQAPGGALQSDRSQLESAILAKDSAGAKAAADKLAADMTGKTTTNLEDLANFDIQALGVLQSDQVTALQNHVGTAGVVRLLESLTGRFGPARFAAMRAR